jgi:hypothetical protein
MMTELLFPESAGAILGKILAGPKPPAEQDGPPWTHDFTWRPDTALFNALRTRIQAADGAALSALWPEIREAWRNQKLTADQRLDLSEAWSARSRRLVAPEGPVSQIVGAPDEFEELRARIETADGGVALGQLGSLAAQAALAGRISDDQASALQSAWERRLTELVAPGNTHEMEPSE